MMRTAPYSLTQSPADMALNNVLYAMYGQYNVRGPYFYPEPRYGMSGLGAPQGCTNGPTANYPAGCVLLFQSVGTAENPYNNGGMYSGSSFPGATYEVNIADVASNAPVSVTVTDPSGNSTTTQMGSTYGDGDFQYIGTQPANAALGTWTQTWYVGFDVVGSISFRMQAAPAPYVATPLASGAAPATEDIGGVIVPITEAQYLSQEQSVVPITTTAPNQSVPPTSQLTTMPTNISNTASMIAAGSTTPSTTASTSTAASSTILGMDQTTLLLVGGGALVLLLVLGGKH